MRHEGLGGFCEDLRAWRAAAAGLRGGFEGIEGEVGTLGGVEGEEEGDGVLGEEWWERMGGYLREGLAEGVRGWDAVWREVRGDGGLVGEGG